MSTTENTPTEPDMATIWKIATPEDIAAWTRGSHHGFGPGQGGRFHPLEQRPHGEESGEDVFADVGDAMLLKMRPAEWDRTVRWTTEEPAGRKPPDDGSVLIHYLPDGCSHVFSAEPIPVSFVSERHPMPLVDGAHVFPETL